MALTFGGLSTDRVEVASDATINDLTAFSWLFWVYRTDNANGRRLFNKDFKKNSEWRANESVNFFVDRATTNSFAVADDGLITTGKWWCVAFTYDESDGARIFYGDLTTAMQEVTYATPDSGAGATTADGSTTLYIGNRGATSHGFGGDIAVCQIFDARLTLAQLKRNQFFPCNSANCVLYHHYGWGATATSDVPDWSGNANTGVNVTGTAYADHVPIRAPFGMDIGWQGAYTAPPPSAGPPSLALLGVGR